MKFGYVLIGAALALASCSGSETETDTEADSNQLVSETAASELPVASAESADSAEPDPAAAGKQTLNVDEAVKAYHEFLTARDEAYMNPDSDLSQFETLAAPAVVTEVEKFWGRNRVFSESEAGILGRTTTSDVVSAEARSGVVSIVDCIEMREDNQDDSFSPVRFIEHEVQMVPQGENWLVQSINVTLSGDIAGTDWFSCVPKNHQERVISTVEGFGDEVFTWKSDPEPQISAALLAFLDGPLRDEGAIALEQQREEFGNRYMSGSEERAVTVVGSDVATGGWNFLVELCSFYPSGEVWTDVSSGTEVVQRPPDSATRIGYRVLSTEAADGSWSDVIVDLTPVEAPSPCWVELGRN